jgi:hypothetical protein
MSLGFQLSNRGEYMTGELVESNNRLISDGIYKRQLPEKIFEIPRRPAKPSICTCV